MLLTVVKVFFSSQPSDFEGVAITNLHT